MGAMIEHCSHLFYMNDTPKIKIISTNEGTDLFNKIVDLSQSPTGQKAKKIELENPAVSVQSHIPDTTPLITQNEKLLESTDRTKDLLTWVSCHLNIALAAIMIMDYEKALKHVLSLESILSNKEVRNHPELESTLKEAISDLRIHLS